MAVESELPLSETGFDVLDCCSFSHRGICHLQEDSEACMEKGDKEDEKWMVWDGG